MRKVRKEPSRIDPVTVTPDSSGLNPPLMRYMIVMTENTPYMNPLRVLVRKSKYFWSTMPKPVTK